MPWSIQLIFTPIMAKSENFQVGIVVYTLVQLIKCSLNLEKSKSFMLKLSSVMITRFSSFSYLTNSKNKEKWSFLLINTTFHRMEYRNRCSPKLVMCSLLYIITTSYDQAAIEQNWSIHQKYESNDQNCSILH